MEGAFLRPQSRRLQELELRWKGSPNQALAVKAEMMVLNMKFPMPPRGTQFTSTQGRRKREVGVVAL